MYVFAKLVKYEFSFFRFGGGGLGNHLFPWARSVVAAEKYGLKSIEPTWFGIRVGSIIRKESDLRFYGDLFINQNSSICGFKKFLLLIFFKKISEIDLGGKWRQKNSIAVFSGMSGLFQPILYNHRFVYEQLIRMTSPEYLKGLTYDFKNTISLHVRLGDFKVGKQETAIAWFVDIVNLMRNKSGLNLKVCIFSDGTDIELTRLLELENSCRLEFGSSIADLLALSRSYILVGSKGSTFSMWASYLGRMPVIWPVGGLTQRLYFDNFFNEIESDGQSVPQKFFHL